MPTVPCTSPNRPGATEWRSSDDGCNAAGHRRRSNRRRRVSPGAGSDPRYGLVSSGPGIRRAQHLVPAAGHRLAAASSRRRARRDSRSRSFSRPNPARSRSSLGPGRVFPSVRTTSRAAKSEGHVKSGSIHSHRSSLTMTNRQRPCDRLAHNLPIERSSSAPFQRSAPLCPTARTTPGLSALPGNWHRKLG